MKCLLCVPPIKKLSSRIAFTPQIPLGHVMVGSELLRRGHQVQFLDADLQQLSHSKIVKQIQKDSPDCVLLGHPASTIAHSSTIFLAKEIKKKLPQVHTVYGGLFPTYNIQRALTEAEGAVDFIVLHEAEKTTAHLIDQLSQSKNITDIPGIATKDGKYTLATKKEDKILDMDIVAPIWDHCWDLKSYHAYGMPSSVVQFSRGCPKRCSYCGQWDFWKTWRHRSASSFSAEIEQLSDKGVRLFWVADENWSIKQKLFLELLESLRLANKNKHHLVVTMECAHLIRDKDHLKLYKEAGISTIMLGVDGEDEELLGKMPKRYKNSELVKIIDDLRKLGIISVINHFMDAGSSAPPSNLKALRELKGDFYNCLHPTPHNWTPFGERATTEIICQDLTLWDYRHPILGSTKADLLKSSWRAKEVEFRLNIAALWRRYSGSHKQKNPLVKFSYFRSAMVFAYELIELLLKSCKYFFTTNSENKKLCEDY